MTPSKCEQLGVCQSLRCVSCEAAMAESKARRDEAQLAARYAMTFGRIMTKEQSK